MDGKLQQQEQLTLFRFHLLTSHRMRTKNQMIRDFNYTSQCLPDSEALSNNALIASNSLCALLSNVYDKVEDASLLNTSELYSGLSRCIYTTAKIHEFEGGNITETTPFKRSNKNSTATAISNGLADILKVNN